MLEIARADMSDAVEQRLTRLSKKQEQKLKASDGQHEQVTKSGRLLEFPELPTRSHFDRVQVGVH